MNAMEDAERRAVEALGNKIGFGRVMQLCEETWRKRDPIGALTVGPCIGIKDRIDRVDASLATQLQRSIEKNGRIVERLRKLGDVLSGIDGSSPAGSEMEEALRRLCEGNDAIKSILKDEEPAWPAASTK